MAAAGTFRDDGIAHGEKPGALARESASAERPKRTELKPMTSPPPKDGEHLVQPESFGMMGREEGTDGRGLGLSGGGEEVGVVKENAREGSHGGGGGGGGGRHGGLVLDGEYERHDSSAVLGTSTLNADRGGAAGNGGTDGRRSSPMEVAGGGSGGQAESPPDLRDAIPLELGPPPGALAPVPEPDAEAEDLYGDEDGDWDDAGDDAGDDGNWSSWLTGGVGGNAVPSTSDP